MMLKEKDTEKMDGKNRKKQRKLRKRRLRLIRRCAVGAGLFAGGFCLGLFWRTIRGAVAGWFC